MAKKDIISKYQVEIDNIDKQIITLGDVKTAVQSNINQLISPTAQLDEQIAQLTVDINKKIYELTAISSSAIACGCGTYITDENNNEISAVGIAITTTIANGYLDQISDNIITGITTTSIIVGDIVTAVGTASTYVTAGTNVSGIGASIIFLNQSIDNNTAGLTTTFVFTRTTDYGNRIYYYEQAKAHRMNIEDTTYTDTNPFGKLNKTDGSVAFTSGIGSNTIVVGADQNSILELIVSNPGFGFTSSTYYGRTLVGGAGTGAKADIVVSDGEIPATAGGTPVTAGGIGGTLLTVNETPITAGGIGGTPITAGGTGGTPVTAGGTPITINGTPVTAGGTGGTLVTADGTPVTAGATGGNLVTAGGTGGIPVTAGGTSVSSVIINNGGTGYAINNILTIPLFAGATFTVTNVGSSILGIGVDTYIVASSGIGSVFIPYIDTTQTSSCPSTSCSSYAASFSLVENQIIALRLQRDELFNGTNTFKAENKKKYTERYGYIFAEANINQRKNVVNNVINTLNNSTYNQYFL